MAGPYIQMSSKPSVLDKSMDETWGLASAAKAQSTEAKTQAVAAAASAAASAAIASTVDAKATAALNADLVAKLATLDPSVNPCTSVAAKTHTGLGGGVFGETDLSEPTNPGTIFASLDGAKRWKRNYSGPVNVQWFGAKGDGLLDDTGPIQAALNYAQARAATTAGGARNTAAVYFPPGEYLCTAPLDVRYSLGLTMHGEGRAHGWTTDEANSTLLFQFANPAPPRCIDARASGGFHLSRLGVTYDNTATPFIGAILDFCHAEAGGDAFEMIVEHCVFKSKGGAYSTADCCISLHQAITGRFSDNHFFDANYGFRGTYKSQNIHAPISGGAAFDVNTGFTPPPRPSNLRIERSGVGVPTVYTVYGLNAAGDSVSEVIHSNLDATVYGGTFFASVTRFTSDVDPTVTTTLQSCSSYSNVMTFTGNVFHRIGVSAFLNATDTWVIKHGNCFEGSCPKAYLNDDPDGRTLNLTFSNNWYGDAAGPPTWIDCGTSVNIGMRVSHESMVGSIALSEGSGYLMLGNVCTAIVLPADHDAHPILGIVALGNNVPLTNAEGHKGVVDWSNAYHGGGVAPTDKITISGHLMGDRPGNLPPAVQKGADVGSDATVALTSGNDLKGWIALTTGAGAGLSKNLALPANGGSLKSYTSQLSGSYPAANLIDNTPSPTSNNWYSSDGTLPQVFVFEIAEATLTKVSVDPDVDSGDTTRCVKHITVETSPDNSSWTAFANGDCPAHQSDGSFHLTDFAGSASGVKYVRVTVTSNWGSGAITGASEIQIWGVPALLVGRMVELTWGMVRDYANHGYPVVPLTAGNIATAAIMGTLYVEYEADGTACYISTTGIPQSTAFVLGYGPVAD